MTFPGKIQNLLPAPRLTPGRLWAAIAVAVAADGLQMLLGPLGWAFADEIIDLVTMAAVTWLLGFHTLFLPTFAVEFIPMVDMLPTWTGCVLTVIALRKRAQRNAPMVNAQPPVIEKEG